MNLIGIKTNSGFYITDNTEAKEYFDSKIGDKIIDGDKPENTFNKYWFKIKDEPKIIQKYVPQPPINKRWELKDHSLISEKFPSVFKHEDVYVTTDTDYSNKYTEIFQSVISLYEYKEDKQPPTLEPIEFTYYTITEIDEIKTHKGFSYKRVGQWNSEVYPPATEKDLKYDMIALITVPQIMLPSHPCHLSMKATYDIIRSYVKENINNKVAEITSDYDFCFTVKKKITLSKEYKYTVDTNNSIFDKRKRKPRIETRFQTSRAVQIFEMCHKPYDKYTPIEPFQADNQTDLMSVIDNYLAHLIALINEPLCECKMCDGAGVVFNGLPKAKKV